MLRIIMELFCHLSSHLLQSMYLKVKDPVAEGIEFLVQEFGDNDWNYDVELEL